MDAEHIEALKARHGDLYLLSADLDEEGTLEVVVRKPARTMLGRFAEEVMRDPMRAMNNLFFGCLIEPEAARMQALFEQYPGLLMSFGNRLLALAKANLQVLEKKL
jgi:hypothetical protein